MPIHKGFHSATTALNERMDQYPRRANHAAMVTANTYRETKGYTNNADILICAAAEATRVTSDHHDDNS
jgi:hypothetical protein